MATASIASLLLGATPLAAAPFTFTTLFSFNGTTQGGNAVNNNLVPFGKYLYGTTNGGGIAGNGVIFRLNTSTGVEQILYQFTGGADGCYPNGLTLHDKVLYGTAIACGAGGYGSVFSIDIATRTYRTLYSFQNGADGSYPQGNLLAVDGALWGTADYGGTNGAGTLFKIDPASGSFTPLYSFGTGSDAAYPSNGLIVAKGRLYGTTQYGGANNTGTVYSFDITHGTETVLYSFGVFGGTDGYRPASPLLLDNAGDLVGTAQAGGTKNHGVIFAVNRATGTETVLYNFQDHVDGSTPYNGLSFVPHDAASNIAYGVATEGGTADSGTLFRFNLTTNKLTSLHSFTGGTDGYIPSSQLTYANGSFYGTTTAGGTGTAGTIFAFTP